MMIARLVFAGFIAIALAASLTYLRNRPVRGQLVEILPPDSAELDLRGWVHLFQGLYGMSRPWWKRWLIGQPSIALELVADGGVITPRCWFPEELEPLVTAQLRTVLPGCVIQEATADPFTSHLPAVRSRMQLWRDPLWPLAAGKAGALGAVTTSMAEAGSAVVQIVLSPDIGWQRRALVRLDQLAGLPTTNSVLMRIVSWPIGALCSAILPEPVADPIRKPRSHLEPMPPADKAASPGYVAEIRIKAWSATRGQAKHSVQAIASGFRSLDGANGLRPARVWFGHHFDRALAARSRPGQATSILVADELAQVFHLPCGSANLATAPLALAPMPGLAGNGKVLAVADIGGESISIAQENCRHHIHVLGPTGSGKSTLLLNLALDDIRAGRGVGVIDPKGDLVRSLLERIPESEWDRVILVDPAQRDRPIGINVLECDDPDLHDLVCDQVVAIFKKTYERYWGPRTDDILRAAILTLLRTRGTTLCEVPLLLLKPAARKHFLKGLRDPVGLGPFWKEYQATPEAQRLQLVGPLLNKLRSFLLRRTVRNVLGQSTSTVNLADTIDKNKILLVSLAKGVLGEETSRLVGSFMVARLWQAAMERAGRPEASRPDFNLYLDEFQNYLHLPQSLDEVLVEARGYHISLVLANQHLGQLAGPTREALASNARTRVVFQCGQEDARYLAREFDPWLEERHLRNLAPNQAAVRMFSSGHTARPFTGRTRPAPDALGADHSERLVDRALERYGRSRDVVEVEIAARLGRFGFDDGSEEAAS
ncbi:MAG: type IV secretory system conjugative DNA transfer family protein [Candidatus Dormibacteria bacterium]